MLITAFKGESALRECALAVLSEPNQEFWYSPLVKMEVILQPTYHKETLEVRFYEEYFKYAQCWGNLDRMFEIGSRESMRHGIPIIDALHVAAASLARCKLLITSEKTTKPIFRTRLVKVASIVGLKRAGYTAQRLIDGL